MFNWNKMGRKMQMNTYKEVRDWYPTTPRYVTWDANGDTYTIKIFRKVPVNPDAVLLVELPFFNGELEFCSMEDAMNYAWVHFGSRHPIGIGELIEKRFRLQVIQRI